MTTLTIHDVTSTTISQQAHDAFTCQTLTIKTADGQTIALKLFRSEPQVDGVKDVLQDAQDAQDLLEACRQDWAAQEAQEAKEAKEAQEAQEAKEALTRELLLATIKHSLDDWGLSGYPEHSELVRALYLEAKTPGMHVNFHAPTLRMAFIWERSQAGHAFYSKAHKWCSIRTL